jgi:hypothetical protein
MKFVEPRVKYNRDNSLVIQKNTTIRYFLPEATTEIILPNGNDPIMVTTKSECRMKILDLEVYIFDPEQFYIYYNISVLGISSHMLCYFKELPANITEIHFLKTWIAKENIEYMNFAKYDNIRKITTQKNSLLWFYPRYLERHTVIHNDNTRSYLTINKRIRESPKPVIFGGGSDYIYILPEYINMLTLSESVKVLICNELHDYIKHEEKKFTEHIDISHLVHITILYTHENVNVKSHSNLKNRFFL